VSLHNPHPPSAFPPPGLAPQRLQVNIAGPIPECFQSTLWSAARSFQRRGTRHVVLREAARPVLTPRETQVVQRVIGGQTTKKIACELEITASTARVLLSRALMKLGLSRKELVASQAAGLESGGAHAGAGPVHEAMQGATNSRHSPDVIEIADCLA
jgi:DNA-binding CsgD family transcriptional regulator